MGTNITKLVEEILLKAQETQEEFIFQTIRPYCENVLQMKINKEELKQILLRGARQKGKWIEVITDKDDFGETWHFKCSICGVKSNKGYRPLENYCHNCGAEMEVQDADSD